MNEEENKKINFNKLVENYGGAVIGGIIALILCFTRLYRILIIVVVIIAGAFIGNYVQKNKETVKAKVKQLTDQYPLYE